MPKSHVEFALIQLGDGRDRQLPVKGAPDVVKPDARVADRWPRVRPAGLHDQYLCARLGELTGNHRSGGARTDDTNTISGLSDGFTYELQQFAASGTHFTNSDLIALSIGGNDLSVIANTALIPSGAMTSAQNAVAGVEQLVAAGADNIA